MITIKELHKKTLPDYKKDFVKIDYISYYLVRPLCDLLTIFLLNTSVTATGITIVSFYSCLIALVCFAVIPGIKGALVGYLFYFIWNVADGVDGNIARYTETCSKSGDLWDAVAGYVAMVVFFFGAGIVAAGENSIFSVRLISSVNYTVMGAIAGICTMLPRIATQKKESVYGKAASRSLKDRRTFGTAKIIALNLVSINGFAGLLFFIAIITRTVNIFVIAYFFIMLAFGVCSLYSVMRRLDK